MVMSKIKNQLPEKEKITKSDFVIINDGDDLLDSLPLLEKQVNSVTGTLFYYIVSNEINEIKNLLKRGGF